MSTRDHIMIDDVPKMQESGIVSEETLRRIREGVSTGSLVDAQITQHQMEQMRETATQEIARRTGINPDLIGGEFPNIFQCAFNIAHRMQQNGITDRTRTIICNPNGAFHAILPIYQWLEIIGELFDEQANISFFYRPGDKGSGMEWDDHQKEVWFRFMNQPISCHGGIIRNLLPHIIGNIPDVSGHVGDTLHRFLNSIKPMPKFHIHPNNYCLKSESDPATMWRCACVKLILKINPSRQVFEDYATHDNLDELLIVLQGSTNVLILDSAEALKLELIIKKLEGYLRFKELTKLPMLYYQDQVVWFDRHAQNGIVYDPKHVKYWYFPLVTDPDGDKSKMVTVGNLVAQEEDMIQVQIINPDLLNRQLLHLDHSTILNHNFFMTGLHDHYLPMKSLEEIEALCQKYFPYILYGSTQQFLNQYFIFFFDPLHIYRINWEQTFPENIRIIWDQVIEPRLRNHQVIDQINPPKITDPKTNFPILL